nr:hypothetical protein [Candidatus Sigynarchaeota archaeon]
MSPDEAKPPSPDEMKAKLLSELKQQLAGELKEELKKEFAASMKPEKEKKPKAEKEKKTDLPEVEPKENSGVISQLGNLPLPKHILKSLGWGKGDVIDLKVENGKLFGERIGHTNIVPKPRAKSAEGGVEGQDAAAAAQADAASINISRYIEFDFGEKPVIGKMRQILENAFKLYESGNTNDGLKMLDMVDAIELKAEEPDRGKMRMTVVKFLADVLPKHPEAVPIQMLRVMELVKKISTRYLQERAYGFVANAYKQMPQGSAGFEQTLDTLFTLLNRYQVSELYAIISMLETIVKLVQGTNSPHLATTIAYIKDKFAKIDDNDYKIRFIKTLTSLDDFKGAKELAKQFKETTTEGSGERRMVLDALRENRDRQKAYLEKHPELQAEYPEDIDDDIAEDLKEKKTKKKPKETEEPKEAGGPAGAEAKEPGKEGEAPSVEKQEIAPVEDKLEEAQDAEKLEEALDAEKKDLSPAEEKEGTSPEDPSSSSEPKE